MKRILVLVANYPNNQGGVSLMYVHVRNKYYIKHDIDVTVLNFSAEFDYEKEGIKVISLDSYKKSNDVYDILVLHAANLRNHYRFLKKYDKRFTRMLFFFHGHEVLKINEVYPKPYDYVKKNSRLRIFAQNCYDQLKLDVWRKYFLKNAYKIEFVFVSNWLFKEFQHYVGLTKEDLKGNVHIIHNSVGRVFEENTYNYVGDKKYDFITIRSIMDDSKYCVDLIDALARKYSQYSFLMIGRGDYYKVHDIPANVTWINEFLSHQEIMDFIDQSRCGILLTREDTQGVMTCELAVYGIPVITSDIDVCQEICSTLENVKMISNDIDKVDLKGIYEQLLFQVPYTVSNKYSYEQTVRLEEELLKSLGGGVYDFITIRNNLDSSTYCIDIVCSLAEKNPQYRFLLIGKGDFFYYRKMPDNINWINEFLSHDEILFCVNHAKCALMPTRRDTQGVMSCELVTYGIPLITSDLPVCREVFGKVNNVSYINNCDLEINLEEMYKNLLNSYDSKKIDCFGYSRTVCLEERLIDGMDW